MGFYTKATSVAKNKKLARRIILVLTALAIVGYGIWWWAFIDDAGTSKIAKEVQVPSSYQLSSETDNDGNFCWPYISGTCQTTGRSYNNVPTNMNLQQFKKVLLLSKNIKFENVKCLDREYSGSICSATASKGNVKVIVMYTAPGKNDRQDGIFQISAGSIK